MFASLLDAFGSTQVFVFLPFLLFAKGIDPRVIGAFAFAFTFGGFAGKTVLGRLVDRFGAKIVFYISEAVMAVLLIVLILAEQFYSIIGASLLLGIVTRGTVPVIQMIITEPVRESREYNDIFAINNFSRGIANILSPLLYGFVASAASISWSFGIMAIVVLLALVPVMLMKSQPPPAQSLTG
jgi:MFS family permease